MPHSNFSTIYSGNTVQVDLLKSILEGSGIECLLQDEYVGRMPVALLKYVRVRIVVLNSWT